MKKQQSSLRRFSAYFRPVIGYFIMDSFFAILLAGSSVATPYLVQFIFSKANALSNGSLTDYWPLALGAGLFATILVTRLLASFIVTRWGHIMGIKMELNMRRDAINKLHKLKTTHFDKTPTGTYISRIVTDLKDIPEFAHHGPEDLIIALVTSVGGFTYAFMQSWIVGVALLCMFIFGFIIILIIRKKWRVIWTKIREWNSDMSASVGFQVEGISEIKSYNAEKFEHKRFEQYQKGYKKAWVQFYTFEAGFTVTNILIMSFLSIGTTIIGAYLVAQNKITFPQLTGLTAASAILAQPIQKFVNVYTMISRGSSSVDRFWGFMDLPEEKNSGEIIPKAFKGSIEFKNVSFSYLDQDQKIINVFKDFNLKVKAGEKIAIIGETGIGKSTILKLLMKYYEIQEGEILIDGINVNEYDSGTYRGRVGYIQQQTTLFNDSIKNNILYGRPDAKEKEIKSATKEASLDNFISTLPDGYDTIVGPRGSKLSGGQKQRISIARAFLGHSDFMLFDEATSALDNETEQHIKVAVEKLSKDKTTITVAHRLTTIKNADRIIVLGRYGKILQSGTHKDLINKKGYYKDISF